jgi:hypothetical protein
VVVRRRLRLGLARLNRDGRGHDGVFPGSMIYAGYSDGTRYPDGTYWHYIQYGIPVIGHPAGLLSPGMQCVLDNGSPVPPPAPPGGRGSAVQSCLVDCTNLDFSRNSA